MACTAVKLKDLINQNINHKKTAIAYYINQFDSQRYVSAKILPKLKLVLPKNITSPIVLARSEFSVNFEKCFLKYYFRPEVIMYLENELNKTFRNIISLRLVPVNAF